MNKWVGGWVGGALPTFSSLRNSLVMTEYSRGSLPKTACTSVVGGRGGWVGGLIGLQMELTGLEVGE